MTHHSSPSTLCWQDGLLERVHQDLMGRPASLTLDASQPFDRAAATELYLLAAPDADGRAHHTWREDKWRMEWVRRKAMSEQEARWWFERATDVARLAATPVRKSVLESAVELPRDAGVYTARLKAFVEGFGERYGKTTALYTQAYLSVLLNALFPVDEAFCVLHDAVPRAAMLGFMKRFVSRTPDEVAEARLGEEVFKRLKSTLHFGDASETKSLLAMVNRAQHEALSELCIKSALASRISFSATENFATLASTQDVRLLLDIAQDERVRWSPALTRLWFARMGLTRSDVAATGILALKDEDLMDAALEVLEGIEEPGLAEVMLPLASGTISARRANDWFTTCAEEALVYLVNETRERGKRGKRALRVVCWIQENGGCERLDALLASAPQSVRERAEMTLLTKHGPVLGEAQREDLPGWLAAQSRAAKPRGWSKVMDIYRLASLQLVQHDDLRLATPEVHAILTLLMTCADESAQEAHLAAAREDVQEDSRDRFVLSLLEQWRMAGEPARHVWCLHAVGALGGARSIQELAGYAEEWAVTRQHKMVSRALGILARSAHEQGRLELQRLAQRARYKNVRERASALIRELASKYKGGVEAFEDRLIPDLGLDASHPVSFDLGPRQLELQITSQGTLTLRDTHDGSVHTSLPRKRKSDDMALVASARTEWKTLKKQLSEVLRVQVERLRMALIDQRRWDRAHWQQVLLGHVLMRDVLSGLLWGVFDEKNTLTHTFRVASDQTLADLDDELFSLDEKRGHIGLVHPLMLKEPERVAWGAVFGDYEITQPFPQLLRATFSPTHAQLRARMFEHLLGVDVENTGWLRGHLRRHGWVNSGYRSGRVIELERTFARAGTRVVLGLTPGFDPKTSKGDLPQAFQSLKFYAEQEALPYYRVDPIVLSEVLLLLNPFVLEHQKSRGV